MRLNHPETIISPHLTPRQWKNCRPQNQSLVPKRLGAAVPHHVRLQATNMKSLNTEMKRDVKQHTTK